MNLRRTGWWLLLWVALAACGPASTPQARLTPSQVATSTATALPVPSPADSPSPTAIISPSPAPSSIPIPPPSLVCPGKYQAGHPLVVASIYSPAGYESLDVLDVADPLAPTLVCTVNYASYPIQRSQWLSTSEFALVANNPPRLLDVDVGHRSIALIRPLDDGTYLAALSPDPTRFATMEANVSGTRFARLFGPYAKLTLATYPPAGGHGGTIYGFGGPTIEFSPDGSLVLAVDNEANFTDPAVPDLQVFDLQGNRLFWSSRATWAVWATSALYYDGADGVVYRWTYGAPPVGVTKTGWLEPDLSPDRRSIAFLGVTTTANGSTVNLQKLDLGSGVTTTLAATDLRIDPLFVTSSLIWVSELVKCDNCYGGNAPSGNVFAYNLTTGAVAEVKLPEPLAPMAGASLAPAT